MNSINSIQEFVDGIKNNNCKNIIVLSGAGISTSAGIPDFRSKDSGLYHNLNLNLPYPEAVFDLDYFRRHPSPFYTLCRDLFPGTFKPTPCHFFIKILADNNLLLRNYTQNIDMLERLAGLPSDLIVEAHGSFARAKCCGRAIIQNSGKIIIFPNTRGVNNFCMFCKATSKACVVSYSFLVCP